MNPGPVRPLADTELTGDDFKSLLRDASGAEAEHLDALHDHVIAEFVVFGIGAKQLDGFAAYLIDSEGILLKYIGVRAAARRQGSGRTLISEIRQLHPGLSLRAQTDSDGVGFYRALGFSVQQAPPNPHWPEVIRYDCTLTP